jgi:hypothetical protein
MLDLEPDAIKNEEIWGCFYEPNIPELHKGENKLRSEQKREENDEQRCKKLRARENRKNNSSIPTERERKKGRDE